MVQYNNNTIKVKDKKGNDVVATSFRERIGYPENILAEYRTDGSNFNRPDIIAIDMYSKFSGVGPLIDSNEVDIFSFSVGDKYYLPIMGAGVV